MRFLVTFPADHRNLVVMSISIQAVYADAIIGPFSHDIERLRISEYMVIHNRYLVVRIQ